MDDAHGTLQALQAQMPARSDHDVNRCELSGTLSKAPEAVDHWIGCELKVRLAGDKVTFVRLHLNRHQAGVLDGVAPEQRLHVTGSLTYAKGLRMLVVNVETLRLLPVGVSLSRGR